MVLRAIEKWLDSAPLAMILPKSDFAEAVRYIRNHWEALNAYVRDGRVPIDNNSVEQLMKQVALGRNYAEFGIMLTGVKNILRFVLEPEDVVRIITGCPGSVASSLAAESEPTWSGALAVLLEPVLSLPCSLPRSGVSWSYSRVPTTRLPPSSRHPIPTDAWPLCGDYAELGIIAIMPTAGLCRLGFCLDGKDRRITWIVRHRMRHNQRPSRKANSLSSGRKRRRLTFMDGTRDRACSLRRKSA